MRRIKEDSVFCPFQCTKNTFDLLVKKRKQKAEKSKARINIWRRDGCTKNKSINEYFILHEKYASLIELSNTISLIRGMMQKLITKYF